MVAASLTLILYSLDFWEFAWNGPFYKLPHRVMQIMDKSTIPNLIEPLGDENPDVRAFACNLLAERGDGMAVPGLCATHAIRALLKTTNLRVSTSPWRWSEIESTLQPRPCSRTLTFRR